MRFKEFLTEQALLLEDRIAFLKDKFKGIKTDHDTMAQHHDSDAIVVRHSASNNPNTTQDMKRKAMAVRGQNIRAQYEGKPK